MPGTATNYDPTVIIVDAIAQVWAGLAIPTTGNRLTLDADGTPDATANPSAKHMGHTKEGAKITIVSSLAKHFADETAAPIKSTVDVTDMSIEGEFLQLLDTDILDKITAPFGTYGTSTGYKQYQVGRKTLTYDSVAMIWPTPADKTKYMIAHIYSAINEAGMAFSISRKGMSSTPFKFVAHAISTRTATDDLGNLWFQI